MDRIISLSGESDFIDDKAIKQQPMLIQQTQQQFGKDTVFEQVI